MNLPLASAFGNDNPTNGTISRSIPVLVLGAASEIGRAVVGALLDAAHPVIAADRDLEALELLRREGDSAVDLILIRGSSETETAGAALASAVRQLRRPPVAVVVALGGEFAGGGVLDRPAELLRRKLDEDLLPHLIAARHLLPLLAESGRQSTFLLLGGPGADSPWAGYGHLSVSSAALRMLAKVLREETLGSSVRVQQLAIGSPIRTPANQACACPEWPTAREVGERIARLLVAPGDVPLVRLDRRARAE
jgi:NAD(P)-dependent dehydrogenase (short-subunit alcohol dehydrogenase family)